MPDSRYTAIGLYLAILAPLLLMPSIDITAYSAIENESEQLLTFARDTWVIGLYGTTMLGVMVSFIVTTTKIRSGIKWLWILGLFVFYPFVPLALIYRLFWMRESQRIAGSMEEQVEILRNIRRSKNLDENSDVR
jgi:hypothetical protein